MRTPRYILKRRRLDALARTVGWETVLPYCDTKTDAVVLMLRHEDDGNRKIPLLNRFAVFFQGHQQAISDQVLAEAHRILGRSPTRA